MTKILLDVMYEDLYLLLMNFGWIVETVSMQLGVTAQNRDDREVLRYAKENDMVVATADKKFIDILRANRVGVVTVDAVDKARVINEKVGKGSTSV